MTGLEYDIAQDLTALIRIAIALPLVLVGLTLVMLFWREVTNG